MTETRLRELMVDYTSAAEPPVRLQLDDVLQAAGTAAADDPVARPIRLRPKLSRMPWLAAAAAVLVVALTVGWAAVRGRDGGQVGPAGPTASGGPSLRVPNQTAPEGMLDVLREVAARLDDAATVTVAEASSWAPDELGSPRVLEAGQRSGATSWVVDGRRSGDSPVLGIRVTSRIVPPDVPSGSVTGTSCDTATGGSASACHIGTLSDGRGYLEQDTVASGWPELAGDPVGVVRIHSITVRDADIEISVAQTARIRGDSATAIDWGWTVSTDTLLAAAADPRLVPPRPNPMPTLPSYLGCRTYPAPAGCPGAQETISAPPTGTAGSTPAPIAGQPADRVAARVRELALAALGAGARGKVVVRNFTSVDELVERDYPWATSVAGDFSDAADDRYLTILVEQGGASASGCTQSPGLIECTQLPDLGSGRTATYTLAAYAPDPGLRGRVVAQVRVTDGSLSVVVMEAALGTPGGPLPGPGRLALSKDQLVSMAADAGLRLAPPVEWPDPVKGFCRPDASGKTICTTPTGG